MYGGSLWLTTPAAAGTRRACRVPSCRYVESSLAVAASMSWIASELSAATAQQRRIVLLLHSHRELGLASDPGFARLLANSNVAGIFYGHVHIKPWGMTGNFPNTNVPMYNCGASWCV
eukprot:GHRQ01037045.1.p2 GENE.GHRQ01037045.1~~GHRQ01037045.1.p2  ORF type:complete len:118 (+),score=41.91 GHRQ01037045.1:98-451(+)